MDALKHLADYIPKWLERLEKLNSEIPKRQTALAHPAPAARSESSGTPAPKSIRNKGSTESLRPPKEPEVHQRDTTPQPEAPTPTVDERPQSGPPEPPSSSAIAAQTNQARAARQARVPAVLITVYYDSYVQDFFKDLVGFVSESSIMIRKAKMAARVAQIKRLAKLEMPDESDDEGDQKDASGSVELDGPDESLSALYDDLNKILKNVQSMCEHAAHQFLHKAECSKRVEKIAQELINIKELVDREP